MRYLGALLWNNTTAWQTYPTTLPSPSPNLVIHSKPIAHSTLIRMLLPLLLILYQAVCGSSSICPSILRNLSVDTPSLLALNPQDASRSAFLVRRCTGLAWPIYHEQEQQQLASSSVSRIAPYVHVIFFTREEAAAASSSFISLIMRYRANVFPDSASIARRYVTILATSDAHAAQQLRATMQVSGKGGPVVIELNPKSALSGGGLDLGLLAAIVHEGSLCLASSSAVSFVDIIARENIFTELTFAIHHDMMNTTHAAAWVSVSNGSDHSGAKYIQANSANHPHVHASWFAGPCSSVAKLLSAISPTSLQPISFHHHIMQYLYPPAPAPPMAFRLLPVQFAWPLQVIAQHIGCPGDPSKFAPRTCARDESLPWLWSCLPQQQEWSLALFRSCRPLGGPARALVPFYSLMDLRESHNKQQQQQHKLFTVHSFDLHISPALHLKDLWDSLGVRCTLPSDLFCNASSRYALQLQVSAVLAPWLALVHPATHLTEKLMPAMAFISSLFPLHALLELIHQNSAHSY
jgi:hypothetical protein